MPRQKSKKVRESLEDGGKTEQGNVEIGDAGKSKEVKEVGNETIDLSLDKASEEFDLSSTTFDDERLKEIRKQSLKDKNLPGSSKEKSQSPVVSKLREEEKERPTEKRRASRSPSKSPKRGRPSTVEIVGDMFIEMMKDNHKGMAELNNKFDVFIQDQLQLMKDNQKAKETSSTSEQPNVLKKAGKIRTLGKIQIRVGSAY